MPMGISALDILLGSNAIWPWWIIVITSALGIVATLIGVRKNAVSASILLWNLALFIIFSLSVISTIYSQSTSFGILVTESAIWGAGNVAFCVWLLALGRGDTRKVDPLLVIFAAFLSAGLILTSIGLQTGRGPAFNAAGWVFIAAVLINILVSIRALRPGTTVG